MADLSKLRFNGTDYNVKDASAPTRKFNNTYSKTGNLPITSDDTTQTAIGKLENAHDSNQANILYAMKRTGENYLPVTSGTVNNGNIMKLEPVYIKPGYYTFSFKAATGFSGVYEIDFYQADGTTKYALQGQVSSSVVRNFQLTNDVYYVTLYFSGAVTVSEVMVCHELRYIADNSFVDYSLPNSDLTKLEAEDRAALAEEIDAGAKNKLDCNVSALIPLNTYGSWSGSTYSINGGTTSFVVNSNLTITASKSDTGTARSMTFENYTDGSILNGMVISGGTSNVTIIVQKNGGNYETYASSEGSGALISGIPANTSVRIVASIASAVTCSNVIIKPMLCTLADWKVSQKFVPYDTRQWQFIEKSFTSTAADTYEYSGVSFTVPANQIYEFIVADRKEYGRPMGIILADNNTDLLSSLTKCIVGENTMTYSGQPNGLWARQITGMTMPYIHDNTFYVWVKRYSADASTVMLAYRRIK